MNTNTPTLNDLIEINREIAALIRAGVPLELGLRSIAGETQTSFDRLAERLAEHLSSGRSLAEAFALETGSISPIYAAVVEAGMQAGQLPEALDSVARSARVVQDIRQRLGLAMIYPLACLIVALPLAAAVVSIFVPRWKSVMEEFRFPADWSIRALFALNDTLPIWFIRIPLSVIGIVAIVFLLRSGPTAVVWRAITSLKWLPGFGQIQYSLRRAQFLELVALQTSYGIPLELAFPRAANVTEEVNLRRDARLITAALQAGRSFREAVSEAPAISASWKWILVTSQEADQLPVAIRQLAEACRFQATRQAAWFNFAVPTAMAMCVSAAIVLVYTLVVLLPVISLWKGLGLP